MISTGREADTNGYWDALGERGDARWADEGEPGQHDRRGAEAVIALGIGVGTGRNEGPSEGGEALGDAQQPRCQIGAPGIGPDTPCGLSPTGKTRVQLGLGATIAPRADLDVRPNTRAPSPCRSALPVRARESARETANGTGHALNESKGPAAVQPPTGVLHAELEHTSSTPLGHRARRRRRCSPCRNREAAVPVNAGARAISQRRTVEHDEGRSLERLRDTRTSVHRPAPSDPPNRYLRTNGRAQASLGLAESLLELREASTGGVQDHER